jgi:archaellum component FlaC
MINDMLALEHEVADLEAELSDAYKLAKCERDGIIQEYERTLEEVRERLEALKRVYEDPNTDISTLCNALEYALQLLETV